MSGDMSARLPYLTSHLDYMVYELLKNAMRAGEGGGGVLGPVVVVVVVGDQAGCTYVYGCGCVLARVLHMLHNKPAHSAPSLLGLCQSHVLGP